MQNTQKDSSSRLPLRVIAAIFVGIAILILIKAFGGPPYLIHLK